MQRWNNNNAFQDNMIERHLQITRDEEHRQSVDIERHEKFL